MNPKIIKEVFSDDIRKLILNKTEKLLKMRQLASINSDSKDGKFHWDADTFIRYGIHNEPVFVEIHHFILEKMEEWVGLSLVPSYCYASFYGDSGKCPPHVDRGQCEFTLDYCISQSMVWPIYVNHTQDVETVDPVELTYNAQSYELRENEALVFRGTKDWHYRKHPLPEGEFCNMLFFHFVNADYEGELI